MPTTTLPANARVNVFRVVGCGWGYAMFFGDEFDHAETLDARSEVEARKMITEEFPDLAASAVVRVQDGRL